MERLRQLTVLLLCCWSLSAWPFSVRFGQAWEDGALPGDDVARQMETLRERQARYLRLLEEEDGFNGLFFRLEGARGLDGDQGRLRYGIDWELFSNGRHEAERRQMRKRLNSQVQYWQLYSDMWQRLLHERLFVLQRLRERLERHWLQARRSVLARQLKQADAELKAGFMLKDEHEGYRQRLQAAEYRLRALDHSGPDETAMPPSWRLLADRIETWQLSPTETLLAEAERWHPGLKLQALFARRAQLHPEWRDDLETRLYVEGEQADRMGSDGWRVGFRVRLPLDRPANREAIVGLEQDNYRLQASGLRARLRQRLIDLSHQFRRHQAILEVLLKRHESIAEEMRRVRRHADQAIAALPHTPARELRVLERERIDLKKQILEQRLQLLEYLLQISGLTGITELHRLGGVEKGVIQRPVRRNRSMPPATSE